jgi:hypothetical protein
MSSSTPQPVQALPTLPSQPFRLDVPLHNLLQKPLSPPRWRGLSTSPELHLLCPRRSSHSIPHCCTRSSRRHHCPRNRTQDQQAALARIQGHKNHAGLDASVFQVTRPAGRVSADHCLPLHRMEMQSGLPLLVANKRSNWLQSVFHPFSPWIAQLGRCGGRQ